VRSSGREGVQQARVESTVGSTESNSGSWDEGFAATRRAVSRTRTAKTATLPPAPRAFWWVWEFVPAPARATRGAGAGDASATLW